MLFKHPLFNPVANPYLCQSQHPEAVEFQCTHETGYPAIIDLRDKLTLVNFESTIVDYSQLGSFLRITENATSGLRIFLKIGLVLII
jgi:hypothetical protein